MIGDNDTVIRRRDRMISLHVKLAILLAAIVVAAVGALTAFDVFDGIQQDRGTLAESQLALARLATAEVDDLVRHSTQDLRKLADDPSLLAAASLGRFEAIDRRLERYVTKDPSWVSIVFIDATGRVRALSTPDKTMLGTDMSTGPMVVTVLNRRETVLGAPRVGTITRSALAPVAVPIVGDDGQTLGVLIGNISLQRLGRQLASVQLGRVGRVSVVTEDGLLLTDPDPARLLTPTVGMARVIEGATSNTVASDATASLTPVEGTSLVALAVRSDVTGWLSIVQIPSDVLYESSQTEIVRGIVTILLVGGLAALVGLVLARRFTAPISRLQLATQRVASGDTSGAPLQVHTGDELERLADDFEAMRRAIRARTEEADTAQRKLTVALDREHEATRQARAASEAKSTFLANMSHEIRTPLNAVVGMTDVLRDTGLSRFQGECVETIERGSRALLAVLNDILDLSKIEAGRLDLEVAEVDLLELAEDVGELLARRAQEKGLELIVDVDPSVSRHVLSDATRLRQVLTNLLSNAVKFTEHGEIVVRVSSVEGRETRDEVSDSPLVRFEVSDTGIGIDPAVQAHLFAPFTQADTSTTRKFGGTGLGLAISHQIVALMGGTLAVESALGQGSTFSFELSFNLPAGLNVPSLGTGSSLGGRRVLVLGGSPAMRTALHHQLSGIDASVHDALTPDDAEAAVGSSRAGEPFDALIVAGLGAGSDLEHLIQTVRAAPLLSRARLVVLSTHSQHEDAEALRARGVDAVLTRPTRRGPLIQSVLTERAAPVSEAAFASAASDEARILLVDDSPTNRLVMVTMLERLGYEVDAVANGHDAIKSFEQAPYAVILMDCQMPVMDGYETAEAIRECERRRGANGYSVRTPIIAVTADTDAGTKARCLSSGMDDFFSKPVRKAMLQTVVKRWSTCAVAPDTSDRAPARVTPTPDVAIEPVLDPTPATTTMPLDPNAVQALRDLEQGQRPELVSRLIDEFLDYTPRQVPALRTAAGVGDFHTVDRIVHAMKGDASAWGATRLILACDGLEDASDVDAEQLSGRIDALEVAVDEVAGALISLRSGAPA